MFACCNVGFGYFAWVDFNPVDAAIPCLKPGATRTKAGCKREEVASQSTLQRNLIEQHPKVQAHFQALQLLQFGCPPQKRLKSLCGQAGALYFQKLFHLSKEVERRSHLQKAKCEVIQHWHWCKHAGHGEFVGRLEKWRSCTASFFFETKFSSVQVFFWLFCRIGEAFPG